MNTLIIDCSAGLSVYVLAKKEIYSNVDLERKNHSDDLLLIVDDLLRTACVDIRKIDSHLCCFAYRCEYIEISMMSSVVQISVFVYHWR